jgi:hypothetical protein
VPRGYLVDIWSDPGSLGQFQSECGDIQIRAVSGWQFLSECSDIQIRAVSGWQFLSECSDIQIRAVSGWQFLSECSVIHVSHKLEERIETRSTEECKRSTCEDVKCELKALFEVRDSVRRNT